MVRRFFYDTEFIDDGKTIDLLSIGVVAEDGTEYYAVVDDLELINRAHNHPWLRENVVPLLPVAGVWSSETDTVQWDQGHPDIGAVRSRTQIAADLQALFVPAGPWGAIGMGEPCELWAWFGAYDHVALAQLFGRMIDFPPGVPMFTHELVQRWEECGHPIRPAQAAGTQHNALADARWDRALWMVCESVRHVGGCRAGAQRSAPVTG
jgi:hypothetical protein